MTAISGMTTVEAQGRALLLQRLGLMTVIGWLAVLVAAWLVADLPGHKVPAQSALVVLGGGTIVLWLLIRLCVATLAVLVRPPRATTPGARLGLALTAAVAGVAVPAFVMGWAMLLGTGPESAPVTVAGVAVVVTLLVLPAVLAAGAADDRLRLTRRAGGDDPGRPRAGTFEAQTTERGHDPDALVICCSGGGIRSASFCLGGLQRLVQAGLYHRAKAVYAVSGGSWMAAAFATLDHLSAPGEDLFSLDSPELRRFRRDTRYLSSSARQRLLGAFAFVFGLAVNLALVLSALRVASWFLGWGHKIVADNGRLALNGWNGARLPLMVFALGVAAYTTGRVITGLRGRRSQPARADEFVDRLTHLATVALVAGVGVAMVWPGLHFIRWLWQEIPWAEDVRSAFAFLTDVPTLIAGATAVLAFIGLVRSSLKGRAASGGTWSRLVSFLRLRVAPALGSVLVLLGGYLLLSMWSLGYAELFAAGGSVIDRPLWISAVVAIVLPLVNTANSTTLNTVYRNSLAEAYLMRRRRAGGREVAEPIDGQDVPRFSDLSRGGAGAERRPALVLCATANVSDAKIVPAGRAATPFVFASNGMGGPDVVGEPEAGCIGLSDPNLPRGRRLVSAACYERLEPDNTDVAAAMAVSGAALAPVAGRENSNVGPYRLLMSMTNLRLGVWLRNPYWCASDPGTDEPRWHSWVRRLDDQLATPGPWLVLNEGLGRTSITHRYLYVTDGGHLDNLGLIEALRGRPATIIVMDASADAENSFITLAHAIATARMDLGVEISGFDVRATTRTDELHVRRGWMIGEALWPDGRRTRIVYVKALYVRDATLDLSGYKYLNPEFPLTGTADQLYDEFDLEAFRQLGYLITGTALDQMGPPNLQDQLDGGRAAPRFATTANGRG